MSFLTDLPEKNTFVNLSQLRTTANIQTETDLGLKRRYKFTYTPKLTNKEYQTSYQFPKIAFVSQSERLFNQTSKDQMNSPGPGAYNLSHNILTTSVSFSRKGYGTGFLSKVQRFDDRRVYNERYKPGPGQYKSDHYLSMHHSVEISRKGQSLYNAKASESLKKKWIYPGPTTYDPSLLETEGYDGISNVFKSNVQRFKAKNNTNPGPGTYDDKNYAWFRPKKKVVHIKTGGEIRREFKELEKNNLVTEVKEKSKEPKVKRSPLKQQKNFSNYKNEAKEKILQHNILPSKHDVALIKSSVTINNKEMSKDEQDNFTYEIVPNYKQIDKFKLASPRWKKSKSDLKVPGPAYYSPKTIESKLSFNQNSNNFVFSPGVLFKYD